MSAPHAFLRVGRSPNAPRVVSAFAPSATAAAAASADASALNANNLNNDAASSFDTSVASPIARLDAEFNSSALPDSFPPDAVVSPILPTSSLDASMNTVVAAPAAVAVADEDSTLAPISPARLARQRAMAARAAGGSGLVSRYNTAPQSAFASRAHVNANGASSNAHSGADAAATSAGNGAGAGAQSKYATLGGLGSPTAKFTRRPPTTATSVPAVNGSNSNANENVSVSVNAGGSSVRSSYSPSRTSLGQALGLSNPAATANNNSSNNSNTVNASKTVTGSGFRLVMSDNSNNSSASNTANGANVADSAADTSIVSTNSDDSNLSADDDLLATYTVGLGKTASKYPAGANTGTNASSANKDITKSAAATVASEPEAAESAGAVDAWWVALADTERPLPRSSSSSSPLNASPVPSADHGSAAAAAGAGAGAGVGTAVHEYDGTGSESDGDGDGARGGRGTKCKRRVSWGNERVIELPSSKQPSAHNTTAVAEPEADADAVGEDNADTVDMSAWDDVPYRPGSGPSVTSVASAPTSSSAGSLGNGASCAGLHTECEGDSAVASVTTPTNSAAIGATGTSGGAVADATVSRLLSSPESLAGNSPTAASNTAASNAAAAAAAAAAAVTANGIPAELGIDSVYSAAENASGDFATDNTAAAAANDAVLSTPPKASSSNGTPRGSSSGGGGGDLEDEDDTLADLPSATTLFTPNASRGTYTAEDRLNGHSFGSGHSRSHSESETDHGADDGSRSAAQTPGRKSLGQESSESSTPQMQQQQQQQQRQQGTHTPGPYAAETPSPAAVLRRWEGPQLQLTPPTPSTTSSYASSSSSSVPGSAVSASTAPAASAVTAGSAGPIAAVVQGYGYGFLGSDATTNAASASAAFAPDINAAANAAATSAAGAALHRETSDLYASPARAAAPASLAPGTGAAAHRSHSGDGTGNGKAMTPLRSPLPGLPAPDAFSPANRNSSSSAGDGVCIVDGMPSLLSPSGAGASGRPNFGAAQCSDWSPAPNPSNHPISRLLRDGAGGGGGVATMDSVDADRDVEAEAAKGGAHAKSGFVAANNISAASASNGGAFTGFTAPPPPVPVRNAVNASANNVSISGFVAAPSATETVAAPAAAAAAACPLSPLPQPTVPMSPPSRAPVPLFSPPTTSNSNTHSHNQGQGNNATRASLTGFAPVAANNSTAASEHASASKAAAAVVASGGASAAVPSSPLPTLPAPASVSLFASPRRHVDDGKAFFGTAAASGAPAAAAHDGAGLAALSAFNKPHHNANAGAASESANAAPEADPCTPPRPSRMNSANNTHAAAASGAAGCDGSVGAGAALLSPTSRLPGLPTPDVPSSPSCLFAQPSYHSRSGHNAAAAAAPSHSHAGAAQTESASGFNAHNNINNNDASRVNAIANVRPPLSAFARPPLPPSNTTNSAANAAQSQADAAESSGSGTDAVTVTPPRSHGHSHGQTGAAAAAGGVPMSPTSALPGLPEASVPMSPAAKGPVLLFAQPEHHYSNGGYSHGQNGQVAHGHASVSLTGFAPVNASVNASNPQPAANADVESENDDVGNNYQPWRRPDVQAPAHSNNNSPDASGAAEAGNAAAVSAGAGAGVGGWGAPWKAQQAASANHQQQQQHNSAAEVASAIAAEAAAVSAAVAAAAATAAEAEAKAEAEAVAAAGARAKARAAAEVNAYRNNQAIAYQQAQQQQQQWASASGRFSRGSVYDDEANNDSDENDVAYGQAAPYSGAAASKGAFSSAKGSNLSVNSGAPAKISSAYAYPSPASVAAASASASAAATAAAAAATAGSASSVLAQAILSARARAAAVTSASAAAEPLTSLAGELARTGQYLRRNGRSGAVPALAAAIKTVRDGVVVSANIKFQHQM